VVTFANSTWSEDCSLCLRQSSSITSDLVGPPRPSPCCPCPCWASTAYLSPFLGGWARPCSRPPRWPHFPQISGNSPLPHWAQVYLWYFQGGGGGGVVWILGDSPFKIYFAIENAAQSPPPPCLTPDTLKTQQMRKYK
jgi:hypothetical protein